MFTGIFYIILVLSGCEHFSAKNPDLLKSDLPKCRTYAVYPPFDPDPQVSTMIAKKWMATVTLKPCDTIIPFEESLDVLAVMGAHNLSDMMDLVYRKSVRRQIRDHLKVTHLIDIKTDTGSSTSLKAIAKGRVFRLMPFELDNPRGLDKNVLLVDDQKKPLITLSPYHKYFKWLDLLPNSLSMGLSTKRFILAKDETMIAERERSFFPPIFSSLAISSIIHPYQFEPLFDVSLRPYTTLAFYYFDSVITWGIDRTGKKDPNLIPQEERKQNKIHGMIMAPLIGYELSILWPLGTTFLGYAIGPGINTIADNYSDYRSNFHFATQVILGHRVFLSSMGFKRIYVIFQVHNDSMSPSMVAKNDLNIFGKSVGMFGVGYFFPERNYLVRRAM